MFIVKNVKAHDLTAAEDANGDGVNDALQTDLDGDGTVTFFDGDETPPTDGGGGDTALNRGDYVVGFNVGGPAVASQQGLDGVALRGDDDALIAYSGDGATRAPGSDSSANPNGANALPGAFKSYRDGKAWSVEVSGLKDGAYVVVLHTQETYHASGGKRQFDLSIDGTKVADDLDPFVAGGGGDLPVAIEALVQVTGGKFTVTLDAQGSDGIDNAALNAITVYASGDQPGGGLDAGDTGGGTGAEDGQSPFPGPDAPVVADGTLTVAAKNYDFGGQDVAYNDAPGLSGGSDGGRAGSDVEQTTAGDIGWIGEGEWLEYTIAVPQAGQYDFDLLLATAGGGRSVKVDVYLPDAEAPYASTGSIANPSSGSYNRLRGALGRTRDAPGRGPGGPRHLLGRRPGLPGLHDQPGRGAREPGADGHGDRRPGGRRGSGLRARPLGGVLRPRRRRADLRGQRAAGGPGDLVPGRDLRHARRGRRVRRHRHGERRQPLGAVLLHPSRWRRSPSRSLSPSPRGRPRSRARTRRRSRARRSRSTRRTTTTAARAWPTTTRPASRAARTVAGRARTSSRPRAATSAGSPPASGSSTR